MFNFVVVFDFVALAVILGVAAKMKTVAADEVCTANDPPNLSTAVIRIPGLYGEGDDIASALY